MYITEFDIQGKTIRIEPIAKRVVIRIKLFAAIREVQRLRDQKP